MTHAGFFQPVVRQQCRLDTLRPNALYSIDEFWVDTHYMIVYCVYQFTQIYLLLNLENVILKAF